MSSKNSSAAARYRKARTLDQRNQEVARKALSRTRMSSEVKKNEATRKSVSRTPERRAIENERKKQKRKTRASGASSSSDVGDCLRSLYSNTDDSPLEETIQRHLPTDSDTGHFIHGFQTEMDEHQAMSICGCCGYADFQRDHRFCNLTVDDRLRFLASEPLPPPPCLTRSYCPRLKKWYQLHANPDGTPIFLACSTCFEHLQKHSTVPPWSVAGSCDYGRTPTDLLRLSIIEQLLISQVIPFGTLISISPEGDSQLRGHIISFKHDGALRFCDRMPNVLAFEHIAVQFQGSQKQLLLVQTEIHNILNVRPTLVLNWLRFLKQVNPFYFQIEIDEEVSLDSLKCKLLESIQINDDPLTSAIEKMSCGDPSQNSTPGCGFHAVFLQSAIDRAVPKKSTFEEIANIISAIKPKTLSSPMNEFTDNSRLLCLAFPYLFMLGRCYPHAGSLKQRYVNHLLFQHDQRFSQDNRLLFLLFNQLQRHKSCHGISARIRGNPSEIASIEEILSTEPDLFRGVPPIDVQSKLENDCEFRAKVMKLLRFVEIGGAKVPYSPAESKCNLSRLSSMLLKHGLPSWWMTLSPAMHDSPLALRLAVDDSFDEGQIQYITLPQSVKERLKLVANNPVTAARVFHKMVNAVIEHLLQLDVFNRSASSQTRKGAVGVLKSYFICFEAQGRGSLHYHGLLWGSITPTVCSQNAHDGEKSSLISNFFDSVWSASFPLDAHQASRDLEPAILRPGLLTCPNDPNSPEYRERYHGIGPALLRHKHSDTCRKGKSGKIGCRMNFPMSLTPRTEPIQLQVSPNERNPTISSIRRKDVIDPPPLPTGSPFSPTDERILLWELARPLPDDMFIVPHIKTVLNAVGSNTHSVHLGTAEQAKAIVHYLTEYSCKGATQLAATVAPLYAARRKLDEYGSTDDPTRSLLNIFLNKLTGSAEISSQMAASALLGNHSYQTNETFWFCYIWQAYHAFDLPSIVDQDGSDIPSSSTSCPFEPLKPFMHSQHFENSVFFDDSSEVKDDDSLDDFHLELGGSDFADDNFGMLLQIDIDPTNRKINLTSQIDHYRLRGPELQDLNFYEYCSLITIISNKASTHCQGDDSTAPRRGRRPNLSFQFLFGHPLFATHMQRLRSKPATVMLAGRPIPPYPGAESHEKSQQWHTKAEAFSKFCSILLMPWEIGEFKLDGFGSAPSWISCLTSLFHNTSPDGTALYPPDIHRNRMDIYANIVQLKSISSKKQKIMTIWSHKSRKLWNSRKESPHHACSSLGVDEEVDDEVPRDAELMIDSIRSLSMLMGKTSRSSDIQSFLDFQRAAMKRFYKAVPLSVGSSSFPTATTTTYSLHGWYDQDIARARERRCTVEAQNLKPDSPSGMGMSPQQIDLHISSHLSLDQANLIRLIHTCLISNKQFLGCITGGPGTGKSTFAQQLNKSIRFLAGILNTAPTGVAASLLPNGQTLNSALNINPHKYSSSDLPPLTGKSLVMLRNKFADLNIKVLLIDEVSMLTTTLLSQSNDRLKQVSHCETAFGGFSVILLGDFFQLEPIGPALYAPQKSRSSQGSDLFSLFVQYELTTQHRSVDPVHTRKLETMRARYIYPRQNFDTIPPLQGLNTLSHADRYKFSEAPILVASNIERIQLNLLALKHFAKKHNLPILRWRKELDVGSGLMSLADQVHDQLYRNHPELWEYFCVGAPAVLSTNINPPYGLANGTPVQYFSVTFPQDVVLPDLPCVDNSVPYTAGQIIDVPCPHSINVKRRIQVDNGFDPHEVIPIVKARPKKKLNPEKLVLPSFEHGVQLSFAVTFHKAQGMTLKRVIVDVGDRLKHGKKLGRLNWHGLFVALSRVRKSDHIRLLPGEDATSFRFIDDLQPSKHLIEFYQTLDNSK